MKFEFLAILLIASACGSSSEKNSQKYLYFISTDGFISALNRVAIEPLDNKVIVSRVPTSSKDDFVADFSSNKLYMSTGNDAAINVYSLENFENVFQLYSNQQQGITTLAIDPEHNRIFWPDVFFSTINQGSLDGKSTPVKLFNGSRVTSRCTTMIINTKTNTLYFNDYDNNKIYAADLTAGTAPVELLNATNASISNVRDMTLSRDGNSIIWGGDANIVSTDIATKISTVLIDSGGITSIFLDQSTNDLYYSFSDKVFKSSFGGTGTPTLIFTGLYIAAIAVH